MIDAQIVGTARLIEAAIPPGAPFDLVVSALEYVLAKRIVDETPSPDMVAVAAQIVSRHVEQLMFFEMRRRAMENG